jgi:hypothetical protein
MSTEALEEYDRAREFQLTKNEARGILKHVMARRNPDDATIRWPFELLQNAHDAGPRPGGRLVAVEINVATDAGGWPLSQPGRLKGNRRCQLAFGFSMPHTSSAGR